MVTMTAERMVEKVQRRVNRPRPDFDRATISDPFSQSTVLKTILPNPWFAAMRS